MPGTTPSRPSAGRRPRSPRRGRGRARLERRCPALTARKGCGCPGGSTAPGAAAGAARGPSARHGTGRRDEAPGTAEALPNAAKLYRAPAPPGTAPSPLATAARPGRASGYLNVHRVPAQHTSHGVRTAFPRLPAVPEWKGAESEKRRSRQPGQQRPGGRAPPAPGRGRPAGQGRARAGAGAGVRGQV